MPTAGSSSEEEVVPIELVPLHTEWPAQPAGTASAAPEPEPLGHCAPVPVTLITGYLGAGKTTLVNFILTAKHGCRCAVLLNEIGDSADVERALVKEPEGSEASPIGDWVELENGCICCSSKNDMVKALEALMQQRERFEYIIIETTGLANPGPVAAALWTDSELESAVCLDAVVTVVDAKNILRQLQDRPGGGAAEAGSGSSEQSCGGDAPGVNEAQQQLAFADVVLLNKVDLVSEAELSSIVQEVASINMDASVLPCHRCNVDLRHILDTGIYSSSLKGPRMEAGQGSLETRAAAPVTAMARAAAAAGAGALTAAAAAAAEPGLELDEHAHRWGGHPHAEHEHEQEGEGACNGGAVCAGHSEGLSHQHGLDDASRVRTASIVLRGRPLDLQRLRHLLDDLLWEERTPDRPDVFRVKGLLWVDGSAFKHVCQGVYDIYDVVEGPAWQQGEVRYSKLVFIGRRLEPRALEAQLEQCLAANGVVSQS